MAERVKQKKKPRRKRRKSQKLDGETVNPFTGEAAKGQGPSSRQPCPDGTRRNPFLGNLPAITNTVGAIEPYKGSAEQSLSDAVSSRGGINPSTNLTLSSGSSQSWERNQREAANYMEGSHKSSDRSLFSRARMSEHLACRPPPPPFEDTVKRSRLSKYPVKNSKYYDRRKLDSVISSSRRQRQQQEMLKSVNPHSFVMAKVNVIKNPPWTSSEEFMGVYGWLYSNKTELMSKGVARVAAWSARGKIPIGVDITTHLCEAFLMELKYNAGNSYQALSFGYSVAITRFINGLVEASLQGVGITSVAIRFDIPQWVIDLRHEASHKDLPSVGRLRAGATFCLRWLKQYYWKAYQVIQGMQRSESGHNTPEVEATPSLSLLSQPEEEERAEDVVTVISSEGGTVRKLTRGLCSTKHELYVLLSTSNYEVLAGYLMKKQLLRFPDSNTFFVLTVPEATDIVSFAELQVGSADLAMWRKHLLKACEHNPCFKQTLICALIAVVNNCECHASLRNYLCSWLCLLIVEEYQVEEEEGDGVEVVQIIDDDEQFLPGSLDWMTLLNMAQKHSGYYSYAIVNVIVQHLKSTLPESIRDKILYLTTLVTLSDRVGHDSYIPGVRRGTYESEFKQAKAKILRSQSEERGSGLPPAKRAKLDGKSRWSTVEDMSQWVKCPLGLAPGQSAISPTMFDLPTSLDGSSPSDSNASTSIIPDDRDDKGQDAEDEDELEIKFEDGDMFDSAFIENIKYQVILF